MKRKIKRGSTSRMLHIFVQDTTKYDGSGLTGLAYNTAGLTAYYFRQGDTSSTSITLVTATAGTWTSGGFVEVDSTNMPGLYEFHIPDAAISSGKVSYLYFKGAANMSPVMCELELDDVDYNDATAFGLSRIDAATSSRMATFTLPTNFSSLAVTGGGAVTAGTVSDKSGYTVSTVSDKTGYALTSGEHTTIQSDVTTSLTSQGYTTTRAGYLDTLNGLVAAIWAAATSALTTVGSVGKLIVTSVDAAISSRLASGSYSAPPSTSAIASAILSTPSNLLSTDSSGRVTVGSNTDKTGYTLDLTQTVPTSNTAHTVGDAFNAARAQGFGKWVLSGTTISLYANDGTTIVKQFTLDSADSPTQRV